MKIREFLKSKSITIVKFSKDIGLSRNTTMLYISLYEKISNNMFKKNDANLFCGSWVGADIMKNNFKNRKEELK